MIISFTGTEKGMNDSQASRVEIYLKSHDITEAHHGLCIGADSDFHRIVRDVLPGAIIIGHPPVYAGKRADCECDVLMPAKGFVQRDDDIANVSEKVLATPLQDLDEIRDGALINLERYRFDRGIVEITTANPETLHDGTWVTVRHAIKRGKEVTIFFPGGETLTVIDQRYVEKARKTEHAQQREGKAKRTLQKERKVERKVKTW